MSIGATSTGTLTHLVAKGIADKELTMVPAFSYWRHRYAQHSNFATESIAQMFNTNVQFGSDGITLTFNRNGDLMHKIYVVFELPVLRTKLDKNPVPALTTTPTTNAQGFPVLPALAANGRPFVTDRPTGWDVGPFTPANEHNWASYTDTIGYALIRKAELHVGGQLIDSLTSEYMYMWEELTGKPGKRLAEMIGRYDSYRTACAASCWNWDANNTGNYGVSPNYKPPQVKRYYVQLPFYFTHHCGHSMPCIAMQYHQIQLVLSLAPLSSLIVVGHQDVEVLKHQNGQQITPSDVKAYVETKYVYLDRKERDMLVKTPLEYLITQVQTFNITIPRTPDHRPLLAFNHPCIELIWAFRRQYEEKINRWFEFRGRNGQSPLLNARLMLNNSVRFSGNDNYLRQIQPLEHHTNRPSTAIYNYSFALCPEEPWQPSGTLNFSRIDNVQMDFELDLDELGGDGENFTILIFCRSYNKLMMKGGVTHLKFSN